MISRISVTTSPPKIFRLLYFEKSLHFNNYYRIIYYDNTRVESVMFLKESRHIYRCAVIGQAPMRYPWGFDEEDSGCRKLKIELAQQIMALRQGGVSQFLVACDCGVGLYAGEIINGLRAVDSDLMLICYTPHEEQATKWAPYLRERYFTMLEKCTHISVVCPVGTPDAQLQAYRKIICLADVVLCVHDTDLSATDSGENRAFAFAVESHTPTLVLHPKVLTAEWVGERFYPRRS
jgi:uncharacterized phage-like protein YoqJ